MGRGAPPPRDQRVRPVTWSNGSDGVLLVSFVQGLASDVEVDESDSAVAQDPWRLGHAPLRETTPRLLTGLQPPSDVSVPVRFGWTGAHCVLGTVL